MAILDETKARLLRGAVQDNIDVLQGVRSTDVLQGVRSTRPIRRHRIVRPWMLGSLLLIAGMAYLTIPVQVTWRGGGQTANSASIAQDAIVPLADESSAIETALHHPQPLDRAAIPLSIKRIVIDPGHGGEPGTTAQSGITEKEITLDIALRLRRLAKDSHLEVLLTRDGDRSFSLDKRVAFANENKADLFVSIHVNWMEPHTIRALETYYVGPTDDPATMKLASMENKESAYSLSDYKKILDKIYVDERRDESRTLAKAIQGQLYRSLKPANPLLENRGVRTAPFVVLIGTQMPAVLVEVSCLSNEDEVKLLTKQNYRENIALALLQGIRNYATTLNVSSRKGS